MGTQDELSEKLEKISRERLPYDNKEYNKNHLSVLLDILAAFDDRDKEETCSLFTIQKSGDAIRKIDTSLEPFSVELAGKFNKGIEPSLEALVDEGILLKRQSKLNDFNFGIYQINPKYKDAISPSNQVRKRIENFEPNTNLKDFFETHDKTRVYSWVKDPDSFIGKDESLEEKLRRNDPPVDDYKLLSAVAKRKKEMWERELEDGKYRNLSLAAYVMTKKYKKLPSKCERDKKTEKYKYRKRKFSIFSILEQYNANPDEIVGDVVLLGGYIDLRTTDAETFLNDRWSFKEHPYCSNSIKIEFDGELEIPRTSIYDYSLGVLGIISESEGEPIIQVVGFLEQGTLPPELREERDREFNKLQAETIREINNKQIDLEELIQLILKEGQHSKEEEAILRQALSIASDVNGIVDLTQKVAEMEGSERLLELLVEGIEYINLQMDSLI